MILRRVLQPIQPIWMIECVKNLIAQSVTESFRCSLFSSCTGLGTNGLKYPTHLTLPQHAPMPPAAHITQVKLHHNPVFSWLKVKHENEELALQLAVVVQQCCTIPTLCSADYCAFWRLLSRLSVEVTRAVGQGGGRDCTLLYSLRLLPEWLQAVAPGCNHYALATWIHRHSDPWLTLQVSLSIPILQYNTVLPFPRIETVNLLKQNLRKWFFPCLLQSEIKQ